MPDCSIVEYFNDHEGYKCGYCKGKNGSFNRGMWAHSLNVEDYQGLITRGWRRSGQYCYKPSMNVTCCPLYGIRCHAANFKPSKSQRKVAKTMRQFLIDGGQKDIDEWKLLCQRKEDLEKNAKNDVINDKDDEKTFKSSEEKISSEPEPTVDHNTSKEPEPSKVQPKKQPQKGEGPDPSKPKPKKAKQIRLERKREKMIQKGLNPLETFTKKGNQEQDLQDLLPHLNAPENAKHKLEVRLVRSHPRSEEFESTRKESYAVYKKYQTAIHKDEPSECAEKQWMRFLVDSPLNYTDRPFKPGFGSYHNQYWLDGKIIAVGVCDILPNYISSVYLYYDPDYGFLTMGVYSALSEIVMTRKMHELCSSIEYYCMGYYVQSCQKMRYKSNFRGTEILCPETYVWVPIQKCIETLKKSKFSRLNVLDGGSPDAKDEDGEWESLDSLAVLHRRSPSTFGEYQHIKYVVDRGSNRPPDILEELAEKRQLEKEKMGTYARMVGKTCGHRILVFRSDDEDYF